MAKVTISILNADYGHMQGFVDKVSNADALQFDVMDGHFVPNLTMGNKLILWGVPQEKVALIPIGVDISCFNPLSTIERKKKKDADARSASVRKNQGQTSLNLL